jgi:ornithine cyclodeaminase
VATDVLARVDAAELAVLGAGVQARTHLEAIGAVRRIKRARIWSRNQQRAQQLADQEQDKLGFSVVAVGSAEAAVQNADIIATVTASPEPILQRGWLKEGVHINAVGSSIPSTRELDSATMAGARLFVDRRESALNEAGDLLIPMREGAVTADHIVAELGDVIVGKNPGRRSPDELTLFKSLGLAVEDVASAEFVVEKARASRVGKTVQM